MDKALGSENSQEAWLQEEAAQIKAASSDPAAFNQLYLAYVRPVYRYIYSKIGDMHQAEDLTAVVFLEALSSLPRYHHEGHFAAWLFSIARHKVADLYRRHRLEVPIQTIENKSGRQIDPLDRVIQTEASQRLSKLIIQLDERDQELLRLRIVAELNFVEIARLLHSSTEATKKRFYRLIQLLRGQLELDHD